jgi:hypothetical protein
MALIPNSVADPDSYAYEMYHWNNDKTMLELIWPQLVGAAEWQISVSTEYGIPYELVATYDVLGKVPT